MSNAKITVWTIEDSEEHYFNQGKLENATNFSNFWIATPEEGRAIFDLARSIVAKDPTKALPVLPDAIIADYALSDTNNGFAAPVEKWIDKAQAEVLRKYFGKDLRKFFEKDKVTDGDKQAAALEIKDKDTDGDKQAAAFEILVNEKVDEFLDSADEQKIRELAEAFGLDEAKAFEGDSYQKVLAQILGCKEEKLKEAFKQWASRKSLEALKETAKQLGLEVTAQQLDASYVDENKVDENKKWKAIVVKRVVKRMLSPLPILREVARELGVDKRVIVASEILAPLPKKARYADRGNDHMGLETAAMLQSVFSPYYGVSLIPRTARADDVNGPSTAFLEWWLSYGVDGAYDKANGAFNVKGNKSWADAFDAAMCKFRERAASLVSTGVVRIDLVTLCKLAAKEAPKEEKAAGTAKEEKAPEEIPEVIQVESCFGVRDLPLDLMFRDVKAEERREELRKWARGVIDNWEKSRPAGGETVYQTDLEAGVALSEILWERYCGKTYRVMRALRWNYSNLLARIWSIWREKGTECATAEIDNVIKSFYAREKKIDGQQCDDLPEIKVGLNKFRLIVAHYLATFFDRSDDRKEYAFFLVKYCCEIAKSNKSSCFVKAFPGFNMTAATATFRNFKAKKAAHEELKAAKAAHNALVAAKAALKNAKEALEVALAQGFNALINAKNGTAGSMEEKCDVKNYGGGKFSPKARRWAILFTYRRLQLCIERVGEGKKMTTDQLYDALFPFPATEILPWDPCAEKLQAVNLFKLEGILKSRESESGETCLTIANLAKYGFNLPDEEKEAGKTYLYPDEIVVMKMLLGNEN